jgi:membrane-bound lytic murein transglycosylase D
MPEARTLAGPFLVLALLGPGMALPAHAAEPDQPGKAASAPDRKAEPKETKGPTGATAKSKPGAAPAPRPAHDATPRGSLPAFGGADPRHGQGTRKVEAVTPKPVPRASERVAAPKPDKTAKKPSPVLPPGTPQKGTDLATRRQIASGVTADELRAGKQDPELAKLREAERVLFPRALSDFSPGWSWGLPEQPEQGPELFSNGLPPPPETPARSALSSKDADWLKGLTLPNLPIRYDERVVKYLKYFRDSTSGRGVARVWAKKSGRYAAAMRNALARAGLPTDLVWLSLIESGHNPTIVSPAGAAGLWQFMPETARTYGLTVDRWVDQRLDPVEATEAAVRLLSDLYRRFGSWELAMAAYNMGHGGLSRAIRKYNTNDFWELARHEAGIPWETTIYVPKILATAIVMNNKSAFGLDDVEPEPAESFDLIQVAPGTPLADVARAAGTPPEELERKNPMYLAGRVPPSAPGRGSPPYRVRVPAGSAGAATKLLQRPYVAELQTYSVRQGDTPASVARLTGASEATVRELNRIGTQETLAAGTLLFAPPRPTGSVGPDTRGDEPVVIVRQVTPPPDTARVFYAVMPGDTLPSVASVFGVARSDLVAWNALDSSANLQEGMVLQVFPQKSKDLRHVRLFGDASTKVLVVGSNEFFDHFEGLNGKRRMLVTVRAGDTLASIGRRYQTSVGSMERINRRPRSDRLAPGETVVVYADRARFPAPPAARAAAPAPAVTPVSVSSLADRGPAAARRAPVLERSATVER